MDFLLLKMSCTLRSQSKILVLSTKSNCLNYKILYIQIQKMFQKVSHKVSELSRANLQQGKQVVVFKGEHQFIRAECLSLYLPILQVTDFDFHPSQGEHGGPSIKVFFPGAINLTSTLSIYKNEISKKFIQQLDFIKIQIYNFTPGIIQGKFSFS